MKVFYHHDADGRCAAAIVNKRFKNSLKKSDFVEVDYKDEIPITRVGPSEEVIIVDFSLKPELMEELLKCTKNIIWIDHHKTAMEYKYSQDIVGVRSNDLSAAELTWNYLFEGEKMPISVTLIGDYDTWKWVHGDRTLHFHEGLKLQQHGPRASIWLTLLLSDHCGPLVKEIADEGELCTKYRENFCKGYRDSFGHEIEFDGYKTYALNLGHIGSKAFGDLVKKYDFVMTYVHDGKKWTCSLYSEENKVDVSEIAKAHGGGGHAGAAGFTTEDFPFK